MTETYAVLAQKLIAEGATQNEITNYALLAIADQMKAANEVAVIKVLMNLGLATPNSPTVGDLKNIREHLYQTLGWDDLDPDVA